MTFSSLRFLACSCRGISQRSMAGTSPAMTAWKPARRLDRRVLCALALDQLGQRLAGNERLEMWCLLMRREGGFVIERLVEKEFGRFRFRLVNHESPDAWLLLRLRHEPPQDSGNCLGFVWLGFPECRHHQTVSQPCIVEHGSNSFARMSDGGSLDPAATLLVQHGVARFDLMRHGKPLRPRPNNRCCRPGSGFTSRTSAAMTA